MKVDFKYFHLAFQDQISFIKKKKKKKKKDYVDQWSTDKSILKSTTNMRKKKKQINLKYLRKEDCKQLY